MSAEYMAAADLGSNSFHMIIAEIKGKRILRIIDKRREVIRVGLNRFITEEETSRSIEIIRTFKLLADKYNAEIKAAATSAVRESSNSEEFNEKIFKATSVKVEIISGIREAELIFLGASGSLDLKDKNKIVIDIGGGSTEIIFGRNEEIIIPVSLKLGAVRLSHKFFPEYILTEQRINSCKEFVHEEISRQFKNIKPVYDTAIGVSGTIMCTASMISSLKKRTLSGTLNGFHVTHKEVELLQEAVLSRASKEERLLIPGIEAARADVLPAGLLILSGILEFFSIKSLIISEFGLREGIIISYLNSGVNKLR